MSSLQRAYGRARKVKHKLNADYNGHYEALFFQTRKVGKLACVFRAEAAGLGSLVADGTSRGLEKVARLAAKPVKPDKAL